MVGLLVSAGIGVRGGGPRTVRSQQLLFYRMISDPMIYSHEWICYLGHWVRGWAAAVSRIRNGGRTIRSLQLLAPDNASDSWMCCCA